MCGEVLTTNQLNAQCIDMDDELSGLLDPMAPEVEGKFTCYYSPDLGTLLNAGVHDLFVFLVPANSEKFSSVLYSVKLTINKITPKVNWVNNNIRMFIGEKVNPSQFNATCEEVENGTISGTFSYYYRKKNKKLESLTEFVFKKRKEYRISVKFTPDANYIRNYDVASAHIRVRILDRVIDGLYLGLSDRKNVSSASGDVTGQAVTKTSTMELSGVQSNSSKQQQMNLNYKIRNSSPSPMNRVNSKLNSTFNYTLNSTLNTTVNSNLNSTFNSTGFSKKKK